MRAQSGYANNYVYPQFYGTIQWAIGDSGKERTTPWLQQAEQHGWTVKELKSVFEYTFELVTSELNCRFETTIEFKFKMSKGAK